MNLLIESKVFFQRKQSNINETITYFLNGVQKAHFGHYANCAVILGLATTWSIFLSNTAYKDKSRNIHDCTFFRRNFSLKSFVVIQAWLTFFSNLSKKGWSPVQELEVLVQPACLLWWVISKFCYRLQPSTAVYWWTWSNQIEVKRWGPLSRFSGPSEHVQHYRALFFYLLLAQII